MSQTYALAWPIERARDVSRNGVNRPVRVRAPRHEPYLDLPVRDRVELGCGPNKLHRDAIGIDVLAYDGVDIVGTLPEALGEVATESTDVIYSQHFLEHTDDLGRLLEEAARILRPGGRFIAVVPHFSNPHYYSDPTHRTAFGLYSMSYYAVDRIHRRSVPSYVLDEDALQFRLVSADLRFDRSMRRPLSFVVARGAEWSTRRWVRAREYFEYRLPWMLPCMEIRFELERR